jgi:hypothetical protein
MEVEQLAPFLALEHRRLAGSQLRAADRRGRICWDHLADNEPIEQHAHGGELLLD